MEFDFVNTGKGYVSAEKNRDVTTLGLIPVDAVY